MTIVEATLVGIFGILCLLFCEVHNTRIRMRTSVGAAMLVIAIIGILAMVVPILKATVYVCDTIKAGRLLEW